MSANQVLICFKLALLTLLATGLGPAQCVRVHLYPDDEPSSADTHNNYRTLIADPAHYYLKSAGLLHDSNFSRYYQEDSKNRDGKYVKATFAFKSSEYFRKEFSVQWFTPWEEYAALNVYDDPLERDLATGPQVNQKLCGLHLDYMIHLNKKYNQNLDNATEQSIFFIMGTFDMPKVGLHHGNTHFLGDYDACRKLKLNIMKKDLAEVNSQAAEQYFGALAKEEPQQLEGIPKFLYLIRQYLGPFFGYLKEREEWRLLDQHRGKVKALPMRYCLNKMRWPSWRNTTHHIRNDNFKVAACLPETCDSNSLKLHYDKIRQLSGTHMSDYYDGFYISDLYCLPDEQSKLRNPFNYLSTVVFILFNLIWLLFTLLASSMNLKESRKEKRNPSNATSWKGFLKCWSFRKNWRDFVTALPDDNKPDDNSGKEARLDTAPLEGFKVICSMSVITSHACIIGFTSAWNARAGHDILSKGWLAMTNTICPSVVDVFFVITGMITARILYNMQHKVLLKPAFWIKFMLYRYIRIIPLYLFMHWFLQSTFRFLGDGPFWDYQTSHTAWAKLCQDESWWTIIFPSANFKSPAVHCNGVGWYLANDLQFMFLIPFVIVLLVKKPLLGHITVAGTVLALTANHVAFFLEVDQDLYSMFEINLMGIARVLDDATKGYTYPQYRCVAVLIGLAAGHLLYLYEKGTIKEWPKGFLKYGKAYLIFVIYFICFIPYISSLVPVDDPEFLRVLGAIRDGTLHCIISSASAVFVLLLCTNQLPSLNKPLSWYIFKPLSNASLSTLLVHIPLLFYHSQTMQYLPEISAYNMISSTLIWCAQSFAIAIMVHVLYELPMRRFLVKLLLALAVGSGSKQENEVKVKTK